MPYHNSQQLMEQPRIDLSASVRVGTLIGVSRDGCPLVDFPGNDGPPLEARTLVPVRDTTNDQVLLCFEQHNIRMPIIMGYVLDNMASPPPTAIVASPQAFCLEIDGQTVNVNARESIVLRCGMSSITLRKNGKILINGSEIVSRATRRNRIQGGSVAIN